MTIHPTLSAHISDFPPNFLIPKTIDPTTIAFVEEPTALVSPQDALLNHLKNRGLIGEWGECLQNMPLSYPSLKGGPISRLLQFLDTPYSTHWKLYNGEVKSIPITIRHLLHITGYPEIEIVGGGVPWILGKEFFKKMMRELYVPETLLPDTLFEDLKHLPQDFDLRFPSYHVNEDQMESIINTFFYNLSLHLGIHPTDIDKSVKKKWAAKKHHPDKYAIVCIEFFNGNHKAFDVDFLFVKSIRRPYLHKRSGLKLLLNKQQLIPGGFQLNLGNQIPQLQEISIHYLTSLLDADNLQTIDHKGLAITLCGTIKGRYPLRADFFELLFAAHKEKYPLFPWFTPLQDILCTHAAKNPQAIFAALINTITFLGLDAGLKVVQNISSQSCNGNSFPEKIHQAAFHEKAGFYVIRDLIIAHTYLGWGNSIQIFAKNNGRMFELRWASEQSPQPLSFFIAGTLEEALTNLTELDNWEKIADLSDGWLMDATLSSPPFSDLSLEKINKLGTCAAPAAKKLAFFFMLKTYQQTPTDDIAKELFLYFLKLSPLLKKNESERYLYILCTTLTQHPSSFSLPAVSCFEKNLLSRTKDEAPTHHNMVEALFSAGDERLRHLAIAISLNAESTTNNRKQAYQLLNNSLSQRPLETLQTLLEFYPYIEPSHVLSLFINILSILKDKKKNDQKVFIGSIEKILNLLLRSRTSVLNITFIKKITTLLKPIDAELAANFSCTAENTPEIVVESILNLKKQSLTNPNFLDIRKIFLSLSSHQSHEVHRQSLQDIFNIIFEKFAGNQKTLQPFLSFLSRQEIQSLFSNQPGGILIYYKKLAPAIIASTPETRVYALQMLGKALAMDNEKNDAYVIILELFLTLLSKEGNGRKKNEKQPETQLASSIAKILPALYSLAMDAKAMELMSMPLFAQLAHSLPPDVVHEAANNLLKNLENANELQLKRSQENYLTLRKHPAIRMDTALHQEISLAFSNAFLKLEKPVEGIKWVEELHFYDPCIHEILKLAIKKKTIDPLIQLIANDKGCFFDSEESSLEVVNILRLILKKDIQKAANTCILHIKFLKKHIPDISFNNEMTIFIKRLVQTDKQEHKRLALDFLKRFSPIFGPIWDDVFQACVNTSNKDLIAEAWEFFKHAYIEHAPLSTILLLLDKVIGDYHMAQTLLLPNLMPQHFETSRYAKGTPAQLKKSKELIYKNALLFLKENSLFFLDFDVLNTFRAAYLPEIECANAVQEWLTIAPHLHRSCLKFLQKQAAEGCPAIMPSNEIVKAIKQSISFPHDFGLYASNLQILSHENIKNPIRKDLLLEVLEKLISYTLGEAISQSDLSLSYSALECCRVHFSFLFSTNKRKEKIYPLIIQAFPILLHNRIFNALDFSHFQFLYENLIKEIIPLDPPKVYKPDPTLRQQFINEMLKANTIFDLEYLKTILHILESHLIKLVDEANNEKNHIPCTALCLKNFVFSHMFFSVSPTDNIENEHIESAMRVHNNAIDKKMYAISPVIKTMIDIFFQKNTSNAQHIPLKRQATVINQALAELLSNCNLPKLQRAMEIFSNTSYYLKHLPEVTSLHYNLLMNYQSIQPSLTWMGECAYPFLINILDPSSDQSNASNTAENWARHIPDMALHFIKALNLIRADFRKENPLEPMPEELYLLTLTSFQSIKKKRIFPASSPSDYRILLYFVQVATDYIRFNKNRKKACQDLIEVLEGAKQCSPSEKPLFQIALDVLADNTLLSRRLKGLFALMETLVRLEEDSFFVDQPDLYAQAAFQISNILYWELEGNENISEHANVATLPQEVRKEFDTRETSQHTREIAEYTRILNEMHKLLSGKSNEVQPQVP